MRWFGKHKFSKSTQHAVDLSSTEIAIIGIACRLPGAPHYHQFWDNLLQGKNSVSEITPDRWDIHRYYSPDRNAINKSISKWGGLIDQFDYFDAAFFHISPREAASMDPQQRILLEEAWHCIEDSGIPLHELQKEKTSVFIGSMLTDYLPHIFSNQHEYNGYDLLGNCECFLANRISYFFNFDGISETIDEACASSIVTLHEACRSIKNGESVYSLCGGINLIYHPWKFIAYSKANMLSPTGQCKTFDAQADGYVRGEGVGLLLLCPLRLALEKNYHIYGIVKGTAVKHTGKSQSITAPRIEIEQDMIQTALADANVSSETITYVEAHGTGTSLGDPIEVEALTRAFATDKKQYCWIGSVKTNIGHLEAGAGVAGIIKVLLMMQHQHIPATLNVQTVNPIIDFEHSPFILAKQASPWKLPSEIKKRRAGISSFGFSGVNAHAILEEYIPVRTQNSDEQGTFPFILSAKTEESLQRLIQNWRLFAASEAFQKASLNDLCSTLLHGRKSFAYRFGAIVNDKKDILQALHQPNIVTFENSNLTLWLKPLNISFQDFQPMIKSFPLITHAVDVCFKYIKHDNLSKSLEQFIMLYSLSSALIKGGLHPHAIGGENIGEYVATVISGMLSLETAITFLQNSNTDIKIQRPHLVFYSTYHHRQIDPYRITSVYCQGLCSSLKLDHVICKTILKKSRLLFESQHTFKKYVEEWGHLLEKHQLSIEQIFSEEIELENDILLFVSLLLYSSLEKLSHKWHLLEKIELNNEHANEIVQLLLDNVLSANDLDKLLFQGNQIIFEELAETIQVNQYKIDSKKSYTLLRSLQKKLDEISNPTSWLNYLVEEVHKNETVSVPENTIILSDEIDNPLGLYSTKLCQNNITDFLLKLWQHGVNLHWSIWYPNPYHTLALPVYSFIKQRYWYDDKIGSQLNTTLSPSELKQKQKISSTTLVNEKIQIEASTFSIEKNLADLVQQQLSNLLQKILNIDYINPKEQLSQYGIDSIAATDLTIDLEEFYGIELTPAILYEHKTLVSFAQYLLNHHRAALEKKHPIENVSFSAVKEIIPSQIISTNSSKKSSEIKDDDIAIIGMNGLFPHSSTLAQFWENLLQEKNLISEVSGERWDWHQYQQLEGNMKWGGFVEDMDKFDAAFFNISPREAELMDPQQRCFLETVWKTIEDAGYTPRALAKLKTGVFVGVATQDYAALLEKNQQFSAYGPSGVYFSILANRVSYLLNLNGPSIAIDTACSSSLVAIHYAVQAIQNKDCDLAIAGGVNALLLPETFIEFNQAGMLCEDGCCKTFDKSANGYVRGEGAGAVLLKPLKKALADHDVIYGVIKGTAVNHGGNVSSLTVPNPNAQADVIMTACERAQIDINAINYIETHGTGTALGDPIEINGLKIAFAALQQKQNRTLPTHHCGLGSVKTNIGHLEGAAGIASLIKVLLAMKHGKMPGLVHFHELNPYIELKDSPFYIVDKTCDWTKVKDQNEHDLPRYAGISSFGFGGTNAHIIVTESPSIPKTLSSPSKPFYLVTLSARTHSALKQQCDNLIYYLQENKNAALENISYTLNTGRMHFEYRCALVVASTDELLQKITDISTNINKDVATSDSFQGEINKKMEDQAIYDQVLSSIYRELKTITNIEAAMYKKQLAALASLYVKGYELDWELIHQSETHYKLSLPTYPFEKTRYWIEKKSEQVTRPSHQESVTSPQINHAQSADENLFIRLQQKLSGDLAQMLKIKKLDPDKEFNDYGFDSITTTEFAALISEDYQIEITPPILYEHKTLNSFVHYLIENFRPALSVVHPDSTENTLATSIIKNSPSNDNALLTNAENEFSIKLKKEVFYFADHLVRDLPTLPGVVYLELARQAAANMTKKPAVGLQNIVWLKPIHVQDTTQVIIHIDTEKENGKSFQVYTSNLESKEKTLHANGKIIDVLPHMTSHTQLLDMTIIRARCLKKQNQTDIYAKFKLIGLAYGPSFQVIRELIYNDEEALATLTLPIHLEKEAASFALHPSLLDAALQTIFALIPEKKLYLPFSIGQLLIHRPLVNHCYAYAHITHRDAENRLFKFAIQLLDEQGRVLIDIQDFTVREAKPLKQNNLNQNTIYYYQPIWHKIATTPPASNDTNKTILLFDDTDESFNIFKQKLSKQKIIQVKFGKDFREITSQQYQINKQNPDHYKQLLASLDKNKLSFQLVIYRNPILYEEIISDYFIQNALDQVYFPLFFFTQALIQQKIHDPVDIICFNEKNSLVTDALPALAKTIALEHPNLSLKIVYGDRIEAIVSCLTTSEILTRYAADNEKLTSSYQACDLQNTSSHALLKTHGVYLLTGGMGSLGLILARYLAKNYQATLILVGRSPLDETKQDELQSIEKLGGQAIYLQADMGLRHEVDRILDVCKTQFGIINGIIHSAGVLHDAFILKKTKQQIAEVFASKIFATLHLDAATKNETLDFFMLFSSIVATSGNIGQSDYAYANAFMDAFALQREKLHQQGQRNGKTFSINWPFWAEGGMQIDASSELWLEKKFGLTPLTTEQGIRAFCDILNQASGQYIVFNGHPLQFEKKLNITPPPSIKIKSTDDIQNTKKMAEKINEQDIAIIGMHGVFPGANDLKTFWQHLEAVDDLISPIPNTRWSADTTKIKWGGFIEDIDKFDAEFFNISPHEANLMDPQQRLFLEVAWKTIEQAGYNPENLSTTHVGLFVGVSTHDYGELIARLNSISGHVATGITSCILANRISYLLNWQGPSEVIDTACSSSLVAIHHAVNAILNKECELAIAGGVNALLTPTLYHSFTEAGMLDGDGHCKTFDKKANGYVRGEGAGAILLKPLHKAIADNDTIYGIIKSCAVNHGGRVRSLTVPNPEAQSELIVTAIERAHVPIDTITYIETHGTGTPLGDPIEINGLKKAFATLKSIQQKQTLPSAYCGLGSVKSNIGHLEAAAGIASVIKVLLALQAKTLPGVAHLQEINPYIDINDSPFYLLKKTQPWHALHDANNHLLPRRAGISSFGFGGTNAHLIIEEAPPIELAFIKMPYYLITLSAKTNAALQQKIIELAHYLDEPAIAQENLLAHLSFTLNAGRAHYEKRIAWIVSTIDELKKNLEKTEHTIFSVTPQTRTTPTIQTLINKILDQQTAENYHAHLSTLADYYLQGEAIDWPLLYANKSYRHMALPTYPFAKKRYWLSDEKHIENKVPIDDSLLLNAAAENIPTNIVTSRASFKQAVEDYLKHILCNAIQYDPAQIDASQAFEKYGIDSVMIIKLNHILEQNFGPLSKTLFFEYQTLTALADYFVTHHASQLEKMLAIPKEQMVPATIRSHSATEQINNNATTKNTHIDDIAIIGISGRYPQANNLETFWENLKTGKDCVSEIPKNRWDYALYYDANKDKTGKVYSKWGGFIEDVDRFDANFFNISPRDAVLLDPQERLFLETSWQVLEDAGYSREQLAQHAVGVFVGVMYGQYQLFGAEEALKGQAITTGSSYASIANRVSYYFNFHGPSLALDTMCSSSLTAIHLACKSIRDGECQLAIAGGVNVSIHPNKYLFLAQSKFLSSDGRCDSFGEGGDGYVPAEGVGAVLLKSLTQALRDGDHIYGVIKGSTINHGGKTNGYTVPNPVAQAALIKANFEKTQINPNTISYIEAHGTGTSLGDPIEIAGLSQAFGHSANVTFPIGSVKSNIGHAESAAGIAALTKVLLQMQHHLLVPSIHSEKLNANINWTNIPFKVQQEVAVWKNPILMEEGVERKIPLRAAISSFGAGGANAHLIVEEAPVKIKSVIKAKPAYLFTLSALTSMSLQKRVADLYDWLMKQMATVSTVYLEEISYTLNLGRTHFENRIAFIASSLEELQEKLFQYKETGENLQIKQRDIIIENDNQANELMKRLLAVDTQNKEYSSILTALAHFYVSGHLLNWELLHQNETHQRISLPTYPFIKERYWYDTFQTEKENIAGTVSTTIESATSKKLKLKGAIPVNDQASHPPIAKLSLRSLKPDTDAKPVTSSASDNTTIASSLTPTEISPSAISVNKTSVPREDVLNKVIVLTSAVLYLSEDKITLDKTFAEMGIESITGVELIKKINDVFQLSLPASKLYDYPSVNALTDYILSQLIPHQANESSVKQTAAETPASNFAAPTEKLSNILQETNVINHTLDETETDTDIAIIGMAGQFPGAKNLETFWQNLSSGVDSVTEIPKNRWSINAFYDADRNKVNKTYSKWGGFLEDIDVFDPLFFNISPSEAEWMDPQQRLVLQSAWSALENAGYPSRKLTNTACGIYIGVMNNDYLQLIDRLCHSDRNAYQLLGNANSILAARIAYFLNLKGPAVPVDTACSSSLVALHLACQALQNNEVDMMLAGGVTLYLEESSYISMCKAGMLSPEGKCKTFDNQADGFVPGEGVGIVVLKKLKHALRDHDTIYGVIKGSGINQDGKTNGITAPSVISQKELELSVYKRFHINPEKISYVETHGTGTKLGDPIEVEALTEAFKSYTDKKQYCALGSVKTNIGHTSAAAGMASLIKVLLSLQHKKITPSLHFETTNENIDFANSPFYVNTQLKSWESTSSTRYAAISSFGFSGTNAHVVIAEAPTAETEKTTSAKPAYLMSFSAHTEEALKQRLHDLSAWLQSSSAASISLEIISYTLNCCRDHFEKRYAFVVRSLTELNEHLNEIVKSDKSLSLPPSKHQALFSELLIKLIDDLQASNISPDIYYKKLTALSELYNKGYDLDWERLYPGENQRKIALPTYPFAKKHYWLPSSLPKDNQETLSDKNELLDQAEFTAKTHYIVQTISPQAFYLTDHHVNNIPIVPGMVFFEMVRSATNTLLSSVSQPLQFSHLIWHQTLPVNTQPVTVQIALQPIEKNAFSFTVAPSTAHNHLLMQGEVQLKSVTTPTALDIQLIKNRLTQRLNKAAIYQKFTAAHLHYGPHFQVLTDLMMGEQEALAKLSLPAMTEEEINSFELAPNLLDGALQATIGLLPSASQHTYLPSHIEQVTIFGKLPNTCYAYITQQATSEQTLQFDIQITDENGHVLITIQQFNLKATTRYQPNVHLFYCLPEWQATEKMAMTPLHGAIGIINDNNKEWHSVLQQALPQEKIVSIQSENEALLTLNESPPHYLLYVVHDHGENTLSEIIAFSQWLIRQKWPDIHLIFASTSHSAFVNAISAFAKSLHAEHPSIHARYIHINHIKNIIDEFNTQDKEVYYDSHDSRFIKTYAAMNSIEKTLPPPFKEKGVYLITGGMKGLGFIFARYLAEHYHARLILTGRSALNEKQHSALTELEKSGAQITYLAFDIGQSENLPKLLQKIKAKYGLLNGVIHSAGVIHDERIVKKNVADIKQTLAAKVRGTIHLDEMTAAEPLDFFVLFSSVAAIFGNQGQSDYAYANAFMDEFAAEREEKRLENKRSGKTYVINWPYWEEGGMQLDQTTIAWMQNTWGMTPLKTAAGIQAFSTILMQAASQVVVLSGDENKIQNLFAKLTPASSIENTIPETNEFLLPTVKKHVAKQVADLLKLDVSALDADKAFSHYGADSINLTQLATQLNEDYQINLTPAVLFEYATLNQLSEYLLHQYPSAMQTKHHNNKRQATITPLKNSKKIAFKKTSSKIKKTKKSSASTAAFDVAVIGMSGIFPGSPDLNTYWENLQQRKNLLHEIPASRWNWHEYYGDPKENKTKIKWGGFIDDIDKFDAEFFEITPEEAKFMDPQQRLLLQTVWNAIEDAGYSSDDIATQTGLFIGASSSDYAELIQQEHELSEHATTGLAHCILANRISYLLNFHGPSVAIDTACSSSLVAIHQAIQALMIGDCEIAIAGGVNAILTPTLNIEFNQAGVLSENGQCLTFDKNASGYIRGEGVGAIILKPLSKAIADNDRIYGVIKGSAVNHGGHVAALTVPNPTEEANVIVTACARAGVDIHTLSYIETHGTATLLGDPMEISGLKRAFDLWEKQHGKSHLASHCGLGSVKANIGHLEAAAGIASAIKVLLAMQHSILPGHTHFKSLNPYIEFADSPFYVVEKTCPWIRLKNEVDQEIPLRAGISSFGFGGTKAHIILEEAPKENKTVPAAEKNTYLIPLSAKTEQALKQRLIDLEIKLTQNSMDTKINLQNISYTLSMGRKHFPMRCAIIAHSLDELKLIIHHINQGKEHAQYIGPKLKKEAHDASLKKLLAKVLTEMENPLYWQEERYNKRLMFLAELYTAGYEMTWSSLFHGEKPSKVALPTYPFAKTSYWITSASSTLHQFTLPSKE